MRYCEHHTRFILDYPDEGPPRCAACEINRLQAIIEEHRKQNEDWQQKLTMADDEIERLTRERDEVMRQAREFQTDAKRVGDRLDEQDAEIERLKAALAGIQKACGGRETSWLKIDSILRIVKEAIGG